MDFSVVAICGAQGMEEAGWRGVVDASEKGQVVGGLEEAEVVEDGFVSCIRCGEGRVRADVGAKSLLQALLTRKEVVKQGEMFGGDGAAVGTGGEEVVGVHRDE